MVLKDYAKDTKEIANASTEQVENAQRPFIVLLTKPHQLNVYGRGWFLENQGFGPALADGCTRSTTILGSRLRQTDSDERNQLWGIIPWRVESLCALEIDFVSVTEAVDTSVQPERCCSR
jgi:hypothetical protein